ncbi:MAG: penicillin acylase family protein [Candidatus Limnocylindrales bacterium]
MRIVRGVLVVVVVLVLVVVLATGGLLASITGRALPQVGGTLQLGGLHGPVTVRRDVSGIAQITADDPHDLFMAQGFVHASERFWQMEVWRHISSGRLSELFGSGSVKTDEFIRTLGWRQAGQRDLDAASPATKAALQAYADGVNAWIGAHRGSLPLPFVVIGAKAGLGGGLGGYEPEPWTPLDSAAWSKVQAWNLGGNFDSEVFRLAADARLGDPALTNQLTPAYPATAPVEVPTGAPGSGGAGATGGTSFIGAGGATGSTGPAAATAAGSASNPATVSTAAANLAAGWQDLATTAGRLLAVAGLDGAGGTAGDHGIGSNDFVVSAAKSATGHALLANDPHLGLDMPSVWYMNGLHCRVVSAACPYDVVGVSFPGVPAVILGHNARIAWGATNVNPDVEDLFREKIDPADPSHYLYKGRSVAFTVRHEVIKVAGGPDVAIDVRSTGHGPIVSDVSDRLRASGALYSLRWTATAEPDRILDSFFALDTAANWNDFRAALSVYGAPSQNFVYADVDGHIGLQIPGLVPIREDPRDLGDRPVPGWDGLHEWTGYVKYDDLPRLYDPPSGIIATANAAAVDPKYPHLIGREWDPGYRVARITSLLTTAAAHGGVTQATLSAIQLDTYVGRAPLVIDQLGRAVPTTADGATVLDRIRSWDDHCTTDSTGCAACMTFEYRLLRGLFDARLGDLARDYVGSTESWQALIALLGQPTSTWWDDPSTPAHETARDVVSRALDQAGADLRSTFGDPARWTWGREHTIAFREPTLGTSGIGPLEWYFDSGPYPVAGAAGAVDNTYSQYSVAYPDPSDPSFVPQGIRGVFAVTNGPSYRLTIDMGALDAARIVITTGQSGNPFDRHYGDLIGAWLAGGTVPLPFSSAAVDRATATTLTLTP